MKNLEEIFKNLGYTKEEGDKIINTYAIENLTPEKLAKNIKRNNEFLISLGYDKKDIKKMIKILPQIYGYSTENMNQKINAMKKLGYSQEDIIKMTKSLPHIYGYSIENMKQKIEDMKELGYSQEDIIKMTKSLPHIYSYSIENIKEKICNIKELGYSQEDITEMTKSLPAIYGLSIESVKEKIENMKELGYSQKDIIEMTKKLPAIYGLSIENIREKIEFYDSIGLHNLATESTKNLMQSTALSYARYMFFKENNIEINEKNYYKLFLVQKQFQKQYGIKKEELMNRYDYKKQLEQQKDTQKLGKETIDIQGETEYIKETENDIKQQEQKRLEDNEKNIN